MMNCPNCGRELTEGEVCNCMGDDEVNVNPQPAFEPQPQVNEMPNDNTVYQNPYVQQQNYYQPPQGTYYAPVAGGAPQPNNNYAGGYYVPEQPVNVPARTDYPQGYKIKRKYVAVLLGATLGCFGIHNFYLGNSSKAIAQVLLSTVGCLFFFLGPIAALVWSIVETVQLLTETIDRDANGFKIQTFEEALVNAKIKAEKEAEKEA